MLRLRTFQPYYPHLAVLFVSVALLWSSTAIALFECNELGEEWNEYEYPELQRDFLKAVKNAEGYTKAEKERIIKVVDSLTFVDFEHSFSSIFRFSRKGERVADSEVYKQYSSLLFQNYQAGRRFLGTTKKQLSARLLRDVHARVQSTSKDAGEFRVHDVVGSVYRGGELKPSEVAVILENPYLVPELRKTKNGHVGTINYPSAYETKDTALSRIAKKHPELVAECKRLRELYAEGEQTRADDRLAKELTPKLVEALVNERVEWFNRQVKRIGKINSEERLEKYVDLVADFQRDIISIHPFSDGNGRSTRLLAFEFLLAEVGLPPPRLLDPNADYQVTKEAWRAQVKEGIVAQVKLMRDLLHRVQAGLDLETSPEWLSPNMVRAMRLMVKSQRNLDGRGRAKDVPIEPNDVVDYILTRVRQEPDLRRQIESKSVETMQQLMKEYITHVELNVVSVGPSRGQRPAVTMPRFSPIARGANAYREGASADPPASHPKSSEVWVIAPNRKSATKANEQEVIDLFQKPDQQLASPQVKKMTPTEFQKLHQQFNELIADGQLPAMLERATRVAKSHGMLKIADSQRALSAEIAVNNGFLVGYKPASYDLSRVDVNAILSNKYGNAVEVAFEQNFVVGHALPERIDSVIWRRRADAYVTYQRNPKDPQEIWKMPGFRSRVSEKPEDAEVIRLPDE